MDLKAAVAALYQNIAVPVLYCDLRWILLYCNPAAKKQLPTLREGLLLRPQLPTLDWKKVSRELSSGYLVRTTLLSGQYTAAISQTDDGYLLQLMPTDTLPALQGDHSATGVIEGQYRSALSGIFHISSMLRSMLEQEEQYEKTAYLDHIDAGAYRALRLTLALSEYARLSAPDIRLSEQPVEIVSFLTDFCQTVERLLRNSKGVRFSYSLPQEKAVTMLDAERFSMMLLELVDNACRCRMDETEITLSLFLEEDSYTITLSDTGRGMESDRIPDAMLPFVSQEEHGERAGLGLFLASRIAGLHRGSLMISSAPCQGTRVSLRFPLCPPEGGSYTLSAPAENDITDRFSLPYLYLSEYRLVR